MLKILSFILCIDYIFILCLSQVKKSGFHPSRKHVGFSPQIYNIYSAVERGRLWLPLLTVQAVRLENTPHNGVYLTYAYAPALSGKQGSVLLGVLACSIRFAESDSLKSVCCMIYLIKNLNIYKNLGLWNSILF